MSERDKVRVLRILEYVGTREFVDGCLESRSVKGRHLIRGKGAYKGFIQEAIVGETYEVIGTFQDEEGDGDGDLTPSTAADAADSTIERDK